MAASSAIPQIALPSSAPSPTDSSFAATCTTAVPDANGHVPTDACNSYYNFDPAFAPAVAVATLFGLLTVIHVVEAITFRKRYAWVLIMGALWETLAFVLHALGARNQQNVGFAVAHQLLFLLAPLWINAFAYMTLARMVWYFLPTQRLGFLRGSSLSKYFVTADILTFLVQAIGGIMASPTADPDIVQRGLNIYLGGLGCQQFFILIFLCIMGAFHRRALVVAVDMDLSPGVDIDIDRKRSWKGTLYGLYGAILLITIRVCYRIAEYAGGISQSNPIPWHEEYAYALDAFPMMACLLVLAILHPGRALQGPGSELPSRREKKAATRARKAERAAEKAARRNKGSEPVIVSAELTDYESVASVGPPTSGR